MDDVEDRIRNAERLELARVRDDTPEATEAAASAAVSLGRLLETLSRTAEAAAWYERAWSYRARHAGALQHAAHAAHNLGWLRAQAGRTDEAIEWYERSRRRGTLGDRSPPLR